MRKVRFNKGMYVFFLALELYRFVFSSFVCIFIKRDRLVVAYFVTIYVRVVFFFIFSYRQHLIFLVSISFLWFRQHSLPTRVSACAAGGARPAMLDSGAPVPPGEVLKLMCPPSECLSCDRERLKLELFGNSRTHFHASKKQDSEDMCRILERAMCGTRDASQARQCLHTEHLFRVGPVSPAIFDT